MKRIAFGERLKWPTRTDSSTASIILAAAGMGLCFEGDRRTVVSMWRTRSRVALSNGFPTSCRIMSFRLLS